MSYFQSFPATLYEYGENNGITFAEDLSAYAEVFDKVKDNSSFYQDYYVMVGERPDHAAYTLYDDPQLHWTFFLMNPKIRERGWPETVENVVKRLKLNHPDTTLTTQDELFDKFKVGQTVQGQSSLATGIIVRKDLDLGQLVIKTSGTFSVGGEQINSTVEGVILPEIIQTVSAGPEYLSAKHYTENSERVSINPYVGPGSLLSEVSYYDHYISENEDLKQIRVIKPSAIRSVSRAFLDAMES